MHTYMYIKENSGGKNEYYKKTIPVLGQILYKLYSKNTN